MKHDHTFAVMSGVFPGQMPARHVEVPIGLTVAQFLSLMDQRLTAKTPGLKVYLASSRGQTEIYPKMWKHVRPVPGVDVRIVSVPQGDNLRSVLTIVVSVAAIALGGPLASALSLTFTGAAQVATAALTIAGSLLVNALVPIQPPSLGSASAARQNVFSIQGWRNDARPGEAVPSILGKMRYAPPFAATSYTEIVGDQQYVRALFTAGYGPLRISDIRIGESPIDSFDDVQYEVREGRPTDTNCTLYPRQVLEDAANIQLIRPFPRDAEGEIIEDAPSEATPVPRFTAPNSTEASIILAFPNGLFTVDDDGDVQVHTVEVRIRQRLNGVGDWQDVDTLSLTSDKREIIYRQHSWVLPSVGQWEIQVERLSDEPDDTRTSDNVRLAAVQSIRPEYPINMPVPVSQIAVRVRATYQLSGTLNNLNALFEREAPVWNGSSWQMGYSSNAATAFRVALQGNELAYPEDDGLIDLDELADWFAFCKDKGLTFNTVQDEGVKLGDLMLTICGAGRATPRRHGAQWGVVVDQPNRPVIEQFNDTNARPEPWSQTYFTPPDAFRVQFQDETNDYRPAERIIPWPGFVGEPQVTEELPLPGKTNPDEVFREARRRQYEIIYRPTIYAAMSSMQARVVTRGDLVMASFNEIDETHFSAYVRSVNGNMVVLDTFVPAGAARGMRFKDFRSDEIIGTSIVREIADLEFDSPSVRFVDHGHMPEVGQVVHIGPLSRDSTPLRVLGIEPAEDGNGRFIFVPHAPEIDELIDQEFIPPWNSSVGTEFPALIGPPAPPRVVRIRSGVNAGPGFGRNGLQIMLEPILGQASSVDRFQIDIIPVGGTIGQTFVVPAASGALETRTFDEGDVVDLSFAARATNGLWSDFTDPITHTIGGRNPPPPDPDPTP